MIEIRHRGGSCVEKAHFALAKGANAALRALGARALLGPVLTVISACIRSRATITLTVTQDVKLDIPLADAYWAAAAMDGSYEAEVFSLLEALGPGRTLFVDCGANIGWWSLLAELRWGWTAVAIEASAKLVERINEARATNGAHFEIVHRAVWEHDGELLSFRTGDAAHAGGHLADVDGFVADWRVKSVEQVESVTVDSIVLGQASKSLFERVVVKLDVEGAEVEAIRGATRSIDQGALIIYEDHGADRLCTSTNFPQFGPTSLWCRGRSLPDSDGGRSLSLQVRQAQRLQFRSH